LLVLVLVQVLVLMGRRLQGLTKMAVVVIVTVIFVVSLIYR
jgi:hypothetical protein